MRLLALALACFALLVAPARVAGDDDAVPADLAATIQPFVAWLQHDDDVLRALAAFELRRHVADGSVRLAVDALRREEDPIVLGCLLGSLAGRARPDLVGEGGAVLPGLLLRLIDHPHPLLRERAWAVLRRIPARPVSGDAMAWRQWWIAARKAA